MERRRNVLCVLALWSVVVLAVCSIARQCVDRLYPNGDGAGGHSSGATSCEGSETSRAVGGINTMNNGAVYNLHGYSYAVMVTPRGIGYKNVKSACAGTMIAPLFALTAAHCTVSTSTVNDIVVIHGHWTMYKIDSRVSRNVVQIYQHAGYNNTPDVADLSVLQISSPFRDVSHYISLGGQPSDFYYKKLNCEIIGFGRVDRGKYPQVYGYKINVSVNHGPNMCIKRNIKYHMDYSNWQHILCAESKNSSLTCTDESGGPLICHGKQYGVMKDMYNLLGGNETTCDDPNMRTRHVFLYMYTEWISEITGVYYDNLATSTIIRRRHDDVIAFVFCTSLYFIFTAYKI